MSLKFPWVALVSIFTTGLGLFGLCWYESLSSEDKERADNLAIEYARKLYGCTVGELTNAQRARIESLVRDDMGN